MQVNLPPEQRVQVGVETLPDAFCVVYTWTAAAALSLLSAALLIADGVAACFEKEDDMPPLDYDTVNTRHRSSAMPRASMQDATITAKRHSDVGQHLV